MKPILIIYAPVRITPDEISTIMKSVDRNNMLRDEYLTLVVRSKEKTDWEFKGLYFKDFDEVEYEKLKKEIYKSLSENVQSCRD